jgi:hypothetical protein
MVELSVRLVLAGILLFVAGATGMPSFNVAASVGGLQCAVAVLVFLLDRKNLRLPAVSSIIAISDAAMIATCLGCITKYPALEIYGFLALVPLSLANARHHSNPYLMAPIAATSIILSSMAFRSWEMPSMNILGVALTFLVVGCLMKPFEKAPIIEEIATQETHVPLTPEVMLTEMQLIELKETYRQLREAYRDLDRKSRRDRVMSQLSEARNGATSGFYFRLCERIAEITGVQTAVIYTTSSMQDYFLVRGGAGELNQQQLTESLPIKAKQAIAMIREQADKLTRSFEPSRPVTNLILQHESKVIGVLTVSAHSKDAVFEAAEEIQPCISMISAMIVEEQKRESVEKKLAETEVLYAVVANADGAKNRAEVAERVARDLQSALQVEHLAIFQIEGGEIEQLAREGRDLQLIDEFRFETGNGARGWIQEGGKEIILFDARVGETMSSEALIRTRIRSCALIPIGNAPDRTGFILAASDRIGGMDQHILSTLRSASLELTRLFEREGEHSEADGLMAPRQFAAAIGQMKGVMVTLIPIQMRELEHKFGKAALSFGLRKLSLKVRPLVPKGSLICRHPDGMFLVFMPQAEREFAMNWANDVVESDLGDDIRLSDGITRMPIAMRAKVAALDSTAISSVPMKPALAKSA